MPSRDGRYCECGSVVAEFESVCAACSRRSVGPYPSVLYRTGEAAKIPERVANLLRTSRTVAVQTRGAAGDSKASSPSGRATLSYNSSRAAQALGLAVGVLGLEPHEKTSSWAEAWLAFQESPANPHRAGLTDAAGKAEKREWQGRVLTRLREALSKGGGAARRRAPASTNGEDSLGPNYEEHLDMAEFVLTRITHAVGVLEDPGKSDLDCAHVLREYTDKMVIQVCQDLRQWLEQLASLLSLYHVHILDLEAENQGLDVELRSERRLRVNGEEERSKAVMKYDVLQEHWKEEKMNRRCEALLGVKPESKDEVLIYSQQDVDHMLIEWEKENLEPLQDQINELKRAQDLLHTRLKDKNEEVSTLKKASRHSTVETSQVALPSDSVSVLVAVLQGLADRTMDDTTAEMLLRVTRSLKEGGYTLPAVLQEISQMPIPGGSRPGSAGYEGRGEGPGVQHVRRLSAVIDEMEVLENALKKCPQSSGAEQLVPLISWSKQELGNTRSDLGESGPPRWGLGALEFGSPDASETHKSGAGASLASTGKSGAHADAEAELQRRMNAYREKLTAQMTAAKEEAGTEKAGMEEAMEALRAQLEVSEKRNAKLRERLLYLEKLLKAKGLGDEMSEAMKAAGLSEYLQSAPTVFHRLYMDALDRMRRHAEREMQRWQDTAEAAEAIFLGKSLSGKGKSPLPLFTTQGGQTALVGGDDEERSPSPKTPKSPEPPKSPTSKSPSPTSKSPTSKQHKGGEVRWVEGDVEGMRTSGSLSWRAQTSPELLRATNQQERVAEQRRALAAAAAAKVRPKWNQRGEPLDLFIGKPQLILGRPGRPGSKNGSKEVEQAQKGALPPITRKLSDGPLDVTKGGSPRADAGFLLHIERITAYGAGGSPCAGYSSYGAGGLGDSPEPYPSDPSSSRTEPHPEPRPEKSLGHSPPTSGKVSVSGHPRTSGSRLPRLSKSHGTVSTPVLCRPSRLLMQDAGPVG